jgi:hypothetical protein
MVRYSRRFLVWWGLLLFLCKLGRTRQLDYQLRDSETCVLPNVNVLAGTCQETLPVQLKRHLERCTPCSARQAHTEWKTTSHYLFPR